MDGTWWIVLRAMASMLRCLWQRLFVMLKSLYNLFSVKAFEYCSSFLNFTNFSSFFFVSLPFYCFHSLLSLLICLFFPSLIQMQIFWIVFFFLWFHEFFMFSLPFYYYHSLLYCLFCHQVQCLSLKCAIIYYCWLLGAVVVAWGVAGSVKMLISITLRPRSIGSVISSPLLVQTCLLGLVLVMECLRRWVKLVRVCSDFDPKINRLKGNHCISWQVVNNWDWFLKIICFKNYYL